MPTSKRQKKKCHQSNYIHPFYFRLIGLDHIMGPHISTKRLGSLSTSKANSVLLSFKCPRVFSTVKNAVRCDASTACLTHNKHLPSTFAGIMHQL